MAFHGGEAKALTHVPNSVVAVEMRGHMTCSDERFSPSGRFSRGRLAHARSAVAPGLKASTAPTLLLSYTGISTAHGEAAIPDASKLRDGALQPQPHEIVSCFKGKDCERVWGAMSHPGDDPRRVGGKQFQRGAGSGDAWYASKRGNDKADALSTPLSDGWSAVQRLRRWQAVAHLRSDNRQHSFGLHCLQQVLEFLV